MLYNSITEYSYFHENSFLKDSKKSGCAARERVHPLFCAPPVPTRKHRTLSIRRSAVSIFSKSNFENFCIIFLSRNVSRHVSDITEK